MPPKRVGRVVDNLTSKIGKFIRTSPSMGSQSGASISGAGHSQQYSPTSGARANPVQHYPQVASGQATLSQSLPRPASAAFMGLEAALNKIHLGSMVIPPLHAAVDAVRSCVEIFKSVAVREQEHTALARQLDAIGSMLEAQMRNPESFRMTGVATSLFKIIEREIIEINGKQQRGIMRYAHPAEDNERLERDYRRIKGLFCRLQVEIGMNGWMIANEHLSNARLEGLDPAKLAGYDSKLGTEINRRTCSRYTRTSILSDLVSWSEDPSGKQIYWMNGMAGTGKTTIACTLAEILESRGQLGASFFCTRTSPECRDATRILPTIAYQLARISTPFRAALCQALDEDPDIGSRNIVVQFEKLLKGPLEKIKDNLGSSVVVVIDAVDECDNVDAVKLVLSAVLRFAQDLPIRHFITSRPEPRIYEKMSQNEDVRTVLHLHEIEKSLVEADIELYLQDELAHCLTDQASIKQLAKLAGNLFIYAATAVRYICPANVTVNHDQRLTTMLNTRSFSTKKHSDIDALYTTILSVALENEELEPNEMNHIQGVLWTTVCIREPVSIKTLATLAGLADDRSVLVPLQPLRSVLHFSESSGMVSILHASFSDYIFSQQRSGRYYCDPCQINQIMAQMCFMVMKNQLRFNICGLESSLIPDTDVANLQGRIAQNISPTLSYACQYWGDHLQPAASSSELRAMLDEFLKEHLLFWMEVLNLKRRIVEGRDTLRQIQGWMASCNVPTGLAKSMNDAYYFVARFSAFAFADSTPHIYVSALPLCPRSNDVYKNYRPKMHGLMEVSGTATLRLERAAAVVWTSDFGIFSIALSPDGSLFAFSNEVGDVYVRNIHNGLLVAGPFNGRNGEVLSLACSSDGPRVVYCSEVGDLFVWGVEEGGNIAGPFKQAGADQAVLSPDGTYVASLSYDHISIYVWNIQSKPQAAVLFKVCASSVRALCISPDGKHIACGTCDGVVYIWVAEDGAEVAKLVGHTGDVRSVAFSADRQSVASASVDCTIRVWGLLDGSLITSPLVGHTGPVLSVAFSSDGTRLVSGSADQTVRVWRIDSGELVAGPFAGHTYGVDIVGFSANDAYIVSCSEGSTRLWNPHSIAHPTDSLDSGLHKPLVAQFSPNGSSLVSCAEDLAVCMWSACGGTSLATLGPQPTAPRPANSVSLSSDGRRVLAGFSDCTVRLWKMNDATCTSSNFQGNHHPVVSVCISLDSSRVACGSTAGTVCIWDVEQGILITPPIEGHSDAVRAIVFSPDGAHIASGDDGSTVWVWNTDNGLPIAGPIKKHTEKISSLDFSPDGGHIVSGSGDGTVCVWGLNDGASIFHPFTCHDSAVTSVKFSPNGALIVSGCFKGTICVWNSVDGTLIAGPLQLDTESVASISFSPDSTRVLFCFRDAHYYEFGRVRMWELMSSNDIHASLRGCWNACDDGWFINDHSHLLFAVPTDMVPYFPTAHKSFTISRHGNLIVDCSNVLIGERWHECYIGS